MTATTWTSRLGAFSRDSDAAAQKGLHAAAYVLRSGVQRNLKGGYTSGDFVTGASINAVTISGIVKESDGYSIAVGTNLLYNLYWELGHWNVFTRSHQRVEKWRPALMDNRDAIASAYTRVYTQNLEKWRA